MAAVVFVCASVALPGSGAAHPGRWYWTLAKEMRMIDNARIRVGSRVVRVHTATTLCSGDGRMIRRDGFRRWKHFMCTFTTFGPRGVDRDLDFRVHVLGKWRFLITDAHWIGETR